MSESKPSASDVNNEHEEFGSEPPPPKKRKGRKKASRKGCISTFFYFGTKKFLKLEIPVMGYQGDTIDPISMAFRETIDADERNNWDKFIDPIKEDASIADDVRKNRYYENDCRQDVFRQDVFRQRSEVPINIYSFKKYQRSSDSTFTYWKKAFSDENM